MIVSFYPKGNEIAKVDGLEGLKELRELVLDKNKIKVGQLPRLLSKYHFSEGDEGGGEGEVAFFSAKRWDRRNRAVLVDSTTPCHDALVVGPYRDSNPLRLTALAAMSEDYTTAPQHFQHYCLNTIFDIVVQH